jgi:hypothetical protein
MFSKLEALEKRSRQRFPSLEKPKSGADVQPRFCTRETTSSLEDEECE